MNDTPMVFPQRWDDNKGMELRDWFAGQVLPIIAVDLAKDRNQGDPNDMPRLAAKGAYIYADAMLAARGKDK